MKVHGFKNLHLFVSAPPVLPAFPITGFGDGDDVIDVERSADSATMVVGADGQMSVSIQADKSGTIKVKLAQTSKANRFLNTVINLQEGGANTIAPIFATFKDVYRQDSAIGTYGFIKKKPKLTRGKKTTEQEWELVFERLDIVLGDPVFAGLSTAAAEAAV